MTDALPPCPICGKDDLFIGTDGQPGCPHCEVAVSLPATSSDGMALAQALPMEELRDAYFKVPAGTPEDWQLLEAMPRLFRAIDGVLDAYGGFVRVLDNAREHGYPIHVATRTTCAQHLEHGDDKADDFVFGQGPEGPDS